MTQVISVVIGGLLGGLLTWFVMKWQLKRQLHQANYVHIDCFYREILDYYMRFPQFGDLEKTRVYRSAYAGTELVHYGFFAMLVHTFLETIFDLCVQKDTGFLDPQWVRIFDFHGKLHLTWLLDADRPNELEYVDFMRKRFPAPN